MSRELPSLASKINDARDVWYARFGNNSSYPTVSVSGVTLSANEVYAQGKDMNGSQNARSHAERLKGLAAIS